MSRVNYSNWDYHPFLEVICTAELIREDLAIAAVELTNRDDNTTCFHNMRNSYSFFLVNSQDKLKTAFLATQRTPRVGLEPTGSNQQSAENKELTENTNPVFATGLAKIVQKYIELEQIISAWPKLPEHIKNEIKDLIDKHYMEGKDNDKQ